MIKQLIMTLFLIGLLVHPLNADQKYFKKVKLGGYFDTEWISDRTTNTFSAHRFILNVFSPIHEKLFFYSEIEFEYGGQINSGDNLGELKIEQAWIDYEINKSLFVRSGIILMPFGIVNRFHDSHLRDGAERPIYAKYIVPTTWMDTGIGVHGTFTGFNNEYFDYELYITNGLGDTISGTKGIRSARANFKKDNNKNKSIIGRLGYNPLLNLNSNFNFYQGAYDDEGNKNISMYGLDLLWKFGASEIIGEWARINIDKTTSIPETMNGYYLEFRQHFFWEYLKKSFLAENFDNPVFTMFLRYGKVDLDESVMDNNDKARFTFGLNYRPIENTVYKMEYQINREGVNEIDNNALIGSIAVGF